MEGGALTPRPRRGGALARRRERNARPSALKQNRYVFQMPFSARGVTSDGGGGGGGSGDSDDAATIHHWLAKVVGAVVWATALGVGAVAAFVLSFWAPPAATKNGPPRLPFLGSTLDLLRNAHRLDDWLVEGTVKYGQNNRAWSFSAVRAGSLGPGAVVLVTPAEVKHVLKDRMDRYGKGDASRELAAEMFSSGIFVEDGELWKVHRRMVAPLFSHHMMLEGARVAAHQTAVMVRVLSAFADSGAPVDLQPRFSNFTIDTFCQLAFGTELHTQTEGSAFARAFDSVMVRVFQRFSDPAWKLKRLLGIGAEKKHAADCKLCRGMVADVIRKARTFEDVGRQVQNRTSSGGGGGGSNSSTTSTGSSSRSTGSSSSSSSSSSSNNGSRSSSSSSSSSNNNGSNSSSSSNLATMFMAAARERKLEVGENDVVDFVFTFLLGGRDTTSVALVWCVYELTRHPELERVILDEVAGALPPPPAAAAAAAGNDATATASVATSSPYLTDQPAEVVLDIVSRRLVQTRAIILEVLRLHPPVPRGLRFCVKNDVLNPGMGDGVDGAARESVQVKEGMAVFYSSKAMSLNPLLWDEPERFDHRRFLHARGAGAVGRSGGEESSDGGRDGGGLGGGNDDDNDGADVGGGGSGGASNNSDRGRAATPAAKTPPLSRHTHSLWRPSAVSDFLMPVFNAGPRTCVGRPLAMLETMMALVVLVQRFRVRPAAPEGLSGRVRQSAVAVAADGIECVLSHRNLPPRR